MILPAATTNRYMVSLWSSTSIHIISFFEFKNMLCYHKIILIAPPKRKEQSSCHQISVWWQFFIPHVKNHIPWHDRQEQSLPNGQERRGVLDFLSFSHWFFTQIFLFKAKISDSKKSNFTNFNRSIDRCRRKIYTQNMFSWFLLSLQKAVSANHSNKCKTEYVLWCRCANSEQCLQAWFRNILDLGSDIDNFLTTDTCRWIIIDSDISHSIVHSVSRRAGTARQLYCSDCISLNNQLNVAVFTQRRRLIYGQCC